MKSEQNLVVQIHIETLHSLVIKTMLKTWLRYINYFLRDITAINVLDVSYLKLLIVPWNDDRLNS